MHNVLMQFEPFLSSWHHYDLVIQIIGQVRLVLLEEWCKLFCYHLLEERWGILQTKIYHTRYKGAKHCFKSHFILIFFLDVIIFVSLSNIHLGEDCFAL